MSLHVTLRHAFPGFSLDCAFDAPPGVTALFGRSGSGKTSLINAVAGLLHPNHALVTLNGQTLTDTANRIALPPHRRRIGYVFQEARLFPHLSVSQNLAYGARFNRSNADPAPIIDLLGLQRLLSRRPHALSGGEKQRVAIARALLAAPNLLLMDEPLAALDEARKAEILPYLERLRDHARIPILYVSHALAEVARLATTLILIENGRIARAGPAADILADPAAVPLLGVREAGAILTARLTAHHADGLSTLATAAGTLHVPRINAAIGSQIRLRILAQDVMISLTRPEAISALNILPATVTSLYTGAGPGTAVALASGTDVLLARITTRSAEVLRLAPGTPCFAVLKSVALAQSDLGTQQGRLTTEE